MPSAAPILKAQLKAYKKKYYLNQLLKGVLFSLAIILSAYFFMNVLEYWIRFGKIVRGTMFFGFIFILMYCLVSYMIIPLYRLTNINVQLSDEEAARQIGLYFPEIKDKLLNILQLEKQGFEHNDLIWASIAQKSKSISWIPFANAIDFSINKRYLKFVFPPILLILICLIVIPQLFSEGTSRIVNFSTKFKEPAPFDFVVLNTQLTSFKNEDFQLKLTLKGKALPAQVYLKFQNRKVKMEKLNDTDYQFTFINLQTPIDFEFEASGFVSEVYTLALAARPNLANFDIHIEYPAYINKPEDQLENIGNITVPAGSNITWLLHTEDADSAFINFDNVPFNYLAQRENANTHTFKKLIDKSHEYSIKLKNTGFLNKDKIAYAITTIPDQFPSIDLEQFKDTLLYNFVVVAGNISDDYGFSNLSLCYKLSSSNSYKSLPIRIHKTQLSQMYYYRWSLDSLHLQPGQKLEYYVMVTDNDGFNGPKSSKSAIAQLKIPSEELMAKDIENSLDKSENNIDKTLEKAQALKKNLKKLEDKLKGKKSLSYEDKKQIDDLLKTQEALKKSVENMQKEAENAFEKKKRFDKSENQELAQKNEEIQKLVNELLDEETKKMLEDVQKMLAEKNKDDQIKQSLEKLKNKDEDLAKDLERTLEMLKQMKFEDKLEKNIQKLNELAQKQEALSKENEQPKSDKQAALDKQNQLNKAFEKLQQENKDLAEINKTLENKHDLEQTEQAEEAIKQDQSQSAEQLAKNQSGKAAKSQKSAAQKMKQMAQQMADMQQKMADAEAEENIEALRAILENLLKLSFDQEELMKSFKNVNQSDPLYVQLSQAQVKLKGDAQVIEDSLFALSKRVVKIKLFITKEVGLMNDYIDESVKSIKQRRADVAAGKQQYAMTSINNLALMLSNVLKQMQDQAANAKQGDGMCNKPGKKPGAKPGKKPGLGELQKQLNAQMKELGKKGKSGQQMSEELAKMAARQEMIRNALKELENELGQDGNKAGGNLSKLAEKMEKTEEELINRQITQQTIERQQEIMTRLLEAEKAVREKDTEERRESEVAKQQNVSIPPSFNKYLKQKEKQIEFLKTVSPNFTQYFKQEVGDYFKKIEK
ncbi:MAG: hypothetical protein RL308_952 [Bacteroidota bacterium]|jgi:hypothetical protein